MPTNYPALLVVEEKHVTRHFLLQGEEDLVAAATKLVRERVRLGYWYPEPSHPDASYSFRGKEEQELLALSWEEVEGLPSSLREKVVALRRNYGRAMLNYERDLEFLKDAKALTEAPWEEALTMKVEDGTSLGYALLQERQDYDYEGFRLESFDRLTEEG